MKRRMMLKDEHSCHTEQVAAPRTPPVSRLAQWPCQIQMVPANAPYLDGANLLIAADCAAYAHASFHQDFMRGRITLISCPKLDTTELTAKLTEILEQNHIQSVTVVRMEVSCCSAMEAAVKKALQASGQDTEWQIATLTTDGKIVNKT